MCLIMSNCQYITGMIEWTTQFGQKCKTLLTNVTLHNFTLWSFKKGKLEVLRSCWLSDCWSFPLFSSLLSFPPSRFLVFPPSHCPLSRCPLPALDDLAVDSALGDRVSSEVLFLQVFFKNSLEKKAIFYHASSYHRAFFIATSWAAKISRIAVCSECGQELGEGRMVPKFHLGGWRWLKSFLEPFERST